MSCFSKQNICQRPILTVTNLVSSHRPANSCNTCAPAADVKQENLDRAALYGANILFRPRMDDLPEESARRLKAIFPPHGPDIIIDAAGFEVTVQVRWRALQ